ncbi:MULTISPECIES: NAD(P)-binding domain-containing protein [unclassified Pseudomonas]|uniref:NAD(P)-binding domain-containing protein n=1 Tax=unclassified Pseudomonas TaxID=196821 RepID=UPI000BA42C5B|nr:MULTISPECIES: NAD(P)-binding domain-containing protein [unclassified Pseudomonas]
MSVKMYYDDAASPAVLDDLTVAVIGYGIQGRAFAANLRDSGVHLCVGNIDDEYRSVALADGHQVLTIGDAVTRADVILLLIPDEAHRSVFEEQIRPCYRQGATLLVAHGFSVSEGHVCPLPGLDLAMLAPRMYGEPLRKYFLAGKGAPAYLDVIADASGQTLQRTLAIARAVGFTRAGVMPLQYRQETLLDLFQEQFLAPALVDLIETAFTVLVEHGFDPHAALLELYGSGEMGKMLLDGAEWGLDEVVERQGSPTCQVGYHLYRHRSLPTELLAEQAKGILQHLENGEFAKVLKAEAEKDYPLLKQCRRELRERSLSSTHNEVRRLFRFPSDDPVELYLAQVRPAAS